MMRGRATRWVRAALLSATVPATVPLASAQAQTHVVIVSGLGGEARYSERFRTLGASLARALRERFAVPAANIAWFGEDSTSRDPNYRGLATRAAIDAQFTAIRSRARPGDHVALVLIGHGAGTDSDSRISIPGPDLTVLDVQRIAGQLAQQRVAIVNLTSASGDFLPALAAPGRVVITATKSGYERNESRFGEQFVAAFTHDVADTDKDGRVSLLEAFRYAARETKRIYDDASKIQTEHAQLDDNGTRQGTADPTGRDGQGLLARRWFFDAAGTVAIADERLGALYREKFSLEDQVDSLRLRKKAMETAAYEAELERVLVALARKAREIRQAEGRP